jgi:hypothetical protein
MPALCRPYCYAFDFLHTILFGYLTRVVGSFGCVFVNTLLECEKVHLFFSFFVLVFVHVF